MNNANPTQKVTLVSESIQYEGFSEADLTLYRVNMLKEQLSFCMCPVKQQEFHLSLVQLQEQCTGASLLIQVKVQTEAENLQAKLMAEAKQALREKEKRLCRALLRLRNRLATEVERQDNFLKSKKAHLERSVNEIQQRDTKPSRLVELGLQDLAFLLKHPVMFNGGLFLICFIFSRPIVELGYYMGLFPEAMLTSPGFSFVYLCIALAVSFMLFTLLDFIWFTVDYYYVTGPEDERQHLLVHTEKAAQSMLQEVEMDYVKVRSHLVSILHKVESGPDAPIQEGPVITFKEGPVDLKAPLPPGLS